ncbi:hypothetical protein Pcinc_028716 [Petrolisthes cinctipes]|uniref:Uncharacterized protein n=1 Tax=Petrolisthes cinctipes TaxID=88211 RepID=A0AAE1F2L7_PETCI|nr:hypothetical protein Pcinc_028716 [Petrolisthes cinctipes]
MFDENGEWVEKDGGPRSIPGSLIYKDFLPLPDPDRSTCLYTAYQSFSETVQQANDWLKGLTGVDLVNCESLPFYSSATSPTYLPDSWPSTTHVRGIRVWLRIVPEMETTHNGRLLLSYRDFSPRLDTKNLFSRDHEDANTVLQKVNEYLATRTSPARVLSLQTLDTPLSGVLDLDVDTEKSRLTFPHHGFTKYCRSLRVFLVTLYHRNPKLDTPRITNRSRPHVTLHIMDFQPNAREHTVGEVIERALIWCNTTPKLKLVNMQVLPLKVGRPTLASTWILENPGHVINKFTSFVRVVYILLGNDDDDQVASSTFPTGPKRTATTTKTPTHTLPTRGGVAGGGGDGGKEKGSGGEEESRKLVLSPLRHELHMELENVNKEEESGGNEGVDDLPGVVGMDGVSQQQQQQQQPKHFVGLQRRIFVPKITTSGN